MQEEKGDNIGTSLGGKSAENDLWNEMHVRLVRDLEKRGTLWRYGAKHLKLWTDQIVSGTSGGVNDEPVWEEHIDAVLVPPKVKTPKYHGWILQLSKFNKPGFGNDVFGTATAK